MNDLRLEVEQTTHLWLLDFSHVLPTVILQNGIQIEIQVQGRTFPLYIS